MPSNSPTPSVSIYRYLFFYFAKVKWMVLGALSFIIIGGISYQTGFYYASRVAGVMSENNIDKASQLRQALYYMSLAGIFMLARALFVNAKGLFTARFLPRLRMILTRDLFHQAHRHDLQFFHTEMTGRVAAKINQIIEEFLDIYYLFETPFNSLLQLFISFYFLTRIHWILGILLCVVTLLYMIFVWRMSRCLIQVTSTAKNKKSVVTGVITDTLFNYAVLKNDGNLHREKLYLTHFINPWIRAERKIYKTEFALYSSQSIFRGLLLQGLFLSALIGLWLHHSLSVADFIFAESLITYLMLNGLNVGGKISRFFRSVGGLRDGLNFIYQPLSVKDAPNARDICLKQAAIYFKNVSFSYQKSSETEPLFTDFNLTVRAGEKVGLVGSSGSGKSTLIKLLCRYYDVDSGEITLNHIPLPQIKQESLRAHIAMIEQTPSLFNRTIMENIRYGKLDATDEEVIAAAKKAYCHDFILKLPNGYHSKVGERGVLLSGGERQRIAIARAILKDAPILILDEATSALDSESELFIQKALNELMKNKTVIAIAHRLSTLRTMDYLLVMQEGKIIEKGRHQTLLDKNGAYAHFYRLQTAGYQEER